MQSPPGTGEENEKGADLKLTGVRDGRQDE